MLRKLLHWIACAGFGVLLLTAALAGGPVDASVLAELLLRGPR